MNTAGSFPRSKLLPRDFRLSGLPRWLIVTVAGAAALCFFGIFWVYVAITSPPPPKPTEEAL